MMTKVLSIASVTLREAVRQKLAVNLLVFAIVLVIASLTLSTLTFGEQYRIIVDIALSAMEIFGTLIAVFLGAGLIARDVERRTVYPILAKPVSRGEYLVGRYLGLVTTTTLNMLVMAAVFSAVLAIYLRGVGFVRETPFFAVLATMVVRFAIVGAIACFFSCFTTATLSVIFTLSLVVAGLVASDLVRYWAQQGPVARAAGRLAFVVVPNLEALNLKEAMVYKDVVPAAQLSAALGYGVIYAAGVMALAWAVFSRRDLR
jgi:ABC-type transport system involved in multi-copper enzyme maturation permease subunit